MHSIRNVLAATDFSPGGQLAIQRAAMQASQLRASLALVHVVEDDALTVIRRLLTPGRDLHGRMMGQAEMQLHAEATAVAASHGLQPQILVRKGPPVQELCKSAQASDLLVVGACSGHPVREFTLGKTADHLARLSPRPLLVARRAMAGSYERVLVPVDFSQNSREALFTAMALAPGASFHLVHSIDLPFEGRMRMAGATDEDLAQYRIKSRLQASERLRELADAARAHGRVDGTVVRSGDVRFELTRMVEQERFDLVAIGKQGQSALGDKLLGSVTSWAIEHAGCDVLVVPARAVPAQA